jgi:GTP cyclohydrolase IA
MKQKAALKMIHGTTKGTPASVPAPGQIAARMKEVLGLLGEDTSREGLIKTPERYEKSMHYLMSGYNKQLEDIVNGALFSVNCDEMVVVKNIEFFSMCEHHMLPFFGKVHIAYLPKDKVIGLSKLPRIVDMFARRLQVQERMTQQIAEAVAEVVSPRGVGVLCEAQHFCMMMRGVKKQHSDTITSTMLGGFRKQKATRDEFLALVRR